MPSRVIRGDINASASLGRVSVFADFTFRALLLAVDDFGRFDARPAILKAALFPIRDEISPADVASWVDELAAGADPPVALYESGGRPYLVLTGWEKHRGNSRRAKDSKYPTPTSTPPRDPGDQGDPGISRTSEDLQDIREIPGRNDKDDEGELSACPEIRGILGDPPVCRESRVESRESGVVCRDIPPDTPEPDRRAKSDRKPALFVFPDPFPDEERERLSRWVRRNHAKLGDVDLDFAIAHVADWALGKGERKADWVRAIQGGVRAGWARSPADVIPAGTAQPAKPSHAQRAEANTLSAAREVLSQVTGGPTE